MAYNTGMKYGGRQKGTPNKATARLREAFTEQKFQSRLLRFNGVL
ncbi:hypothetical protein N9811_07405 [Bacteroidia bacterium]|nr:hypothetical protein [Bacteroidia bacterium]